MLNVYETRKAIYSFEMDIQNIENFFFRWSFFFCLFFLQRVQLSFQQVNQALLPLKLRKGKDEEVRCNLRLFVFEKYYTISHFLFSGSGSSGTTLASNTHQTSEFNLQELQWKFLLVKNAIYYRCMTNMRNISKAMMMTIT